MNPLCAQGPSGALATPPGSWHKGTDAKMPVIMLSAVPSVGSSFVSDGTYISPASTQS